MPSGPGGRAGTTVSLTLVLYGCGQAQHNTSHYLTLTFLFASVMCDTEDDTQLHDHRSGN